MHDKTTMAEQEQKGKEARHSGTETWHSSGNPSFSIDAVDPVIPGSSFEPLVQICPAASMIQVQHQIHASVDTNHSVLQYPKCPSQSLYAPASAYSTRGS